MLDFLKAKQGTRGRGLGLLGDALVWVVDKGVENEIQRKLKLLKPKIDKALAQTVTKNVGSFDFVDQGALVNVTLYRFDTGQSWLGGIDWAVGSSPRQAWQKLIDKKVIRPASPPNARYDQEASFMLWYIRPHGMLEVSTIQYPFTLPIKLGKDA